MTLKIGIDVGGTFTDLFLWSTESTVETYKTLSTPEDPSLGVFNGLRAIADARDTTLERLVAEIDTIVHGTTVTTNATLTRKGAKTGLLTTQGVRDALEMRRGIREEQYNNRLQNVVPLVPRYLRRPINGRLDARGDELHPLELDQVRASLRLFADEGVEAVAVCFMNAFANPTHERAVAELVASELPGAFLSVSTEVLPTVRFYNRVSTTVLNAYVGPVLQRYLGALDERLAEVNFAGVLLIMQSNGGVALPEAVRKSPATTLLSGPAGGPRAAAAYTVPAGKDDCIVVDMGGTSFDASVVRNGEAATCNEGEIDRLRIALPMLEISTIGAGGGSIGWIDEGGLLRMGPQSAGANPGPACYGRGGQHATCTDANLLLGYLDPAFFAGGKLSLDVEAARGAIRTQVALPLEVDLEQAAAGMYRVINSNMAHGVREITSKRGLDPREFPLVVAGGAASLHACMIASELEIPTLLVPTTASVLCAAGMLLTDLQHDYVRSYVTPLAKVDPEKLALLVASMTEQGHAELQREGVASARIDHRVALDLRYLKQYHEVTVGVPIDAVDNRERTHVEAITDLFHREHNRLYGYDLQAEGTGLELINVRVRSLGHTDKPELPIVAEGSADAAAAQKGQRRAYVPEKQGFAEMPVFDGHALLAGHVIDGPALIEKADTTLLVSAAYRATVDRHGSCLLERQRG